MAAAERSLRLANNRYMTAITSYLEVVTAQNTALANELQAVDLLTRQMTASVNLIKALGGGWRVSDLLAPASPKPPAAAGRAKEPLGLTARVLSACVPGHGGAKAVLIPRPREPVPVPPSEIPPGPLPNGGFQAASAPP